MDPGSRSPLPRESTRLPAGLLALDDAPFEVRRMIEGSLGTAVHELGDELAEEGSVPETVHVVVRGRARVTARGREGTEIPVRELGPGSVIAPEAASGERSRVTVRATGPLHTLTLHGSVA